MLHRQMSFVEFHKNSNFCQQFFKTAFYLKSHIRLDHTFLKFETKLDGNLVVNLIDLNAAKTFYRRFQETNFQNSLGENTPRPP